MGMTLEAPAVTPHPLEKFPGATAKVTLPMTGLEVVIRKIDVQAITNDRVKHIFSVGDLREVALKWAADAADHMREPGDNPRPGNELDAGDLFKLQRATEVGILRAAVIRPSLDGLLDLYGGNEEQADLGFGPDYRVLVAAVEEFNPAGGEFGLNQARVFPESERSAAESDGGKVRKASKRASAVAQSNT